MLQRENVLTPQEGDSELVVSYTTRKTTEDEFGVDCGGVSLVLSDLFFANLTNGTIYRQRFDASDTADDRRHKIVKTIDWLSSRGGSKLKLIGMCTDRLMHLLFHEASYHCRPAGWLLSCRTLDLNAVCRNQRYSTWKTQLEAYGMKGLPPNWEDFGTHAVNDGNIVYAVAKIFGLLSE